MSDSSLLHWQENGQNRQSHWRAENGTLPPKRILIADDTTKADVAYKQCCEGTALLWRGDFHNAKQLLQALSRRIDRPHKKPRKTPSNITEAFHLHRQAQAQKARILGMLLIEVDADYRINLRRAPEVTAAFEHAYGSAKHGFVVSLREMLGVIGAYEWHKKGVTVNALDGTIFPAYGVFSPLRGEYLELVNQASLPPVCKLAFDIGTGTGVLAAILAKRGISQVIATDNSPKALACAQQNIAQLGLQKQVTIEQADLYPATEQLADLIVCNPPWLPAKPSSTVESAVYDPDSRMLKGYLQGLSAHLNPQGEGWLIMSDFAEHLGLRTRAELLAWIDAAGLKVVDRIDTKPKHSKVQDETDTLHAARKAELTLLWRLKKNITTF